MSDAWELEVEADLKHVKWDTGVRIYSTLWGVIMIVEVFIDMQWYQNPRPGILLDSSEIPALKGIRHEAGPVYLQP